MNKLLGRCAAIGSAALLCIVAVYYLYFKNADVLFMAQMRSAFIATPTFFNECMARPGGLLQWLGCLGTAQFYHPALGVGLLTGVWLAFFLILKKACNIKNVLAPLLLLPVICLLVSIVDMGYWMYYIKQPGYYFRESIGLLSVALLMWLSKADRFAAIGSVVAALSYPLIGFYSPLSLGAIALLALTKKRYVGIAVAVVLGIVSPLLFSKLYTTMRPDEVFSVGFPRFEYTSIAVPAMAKPLMWALAFSFALIPLGLVKEIKQKFQPWLLGLQLAVVGAGVAMVEKYNYDDTNFIAECKAYRALDEGKWEDVLTAAREVHAPLTRQMMLMRNIALFNTGEIGESIYDYDNTGITPDTGDSLRVHIIETAGPIIYYHHGMMNYAYRWCVEGMVENGLRISDMKIALLSSLVMGDYGASKRYIKLLANTPYHKEWAERYLPIISNPKLISQYKELEKCRELNRHIIADAGTDEGICEKYILEYFSTLRGVRSPYVQEVVLAYAMMSKDIQRFWPQYLNYMALHPGKEMPIHFQEAAFLYGKLEPQTAPNPMQYGLRFDADRIIKRCSEFDSRARSLSSTGMSEQSVASALHSSYGNTFWWNYFFNNHSTYY